MLVWKDEKETEHGLLKKGVKFGEWGQTELFDLLSLIKLGG